jgi:ribosomal protein S18 acetylase RimI-like enzyme
VSETGRPRARVGRASASDAAALARLAAASLPEPWSEAGFAEEIQVPDARVWLVRDPAGAPIAYLVAHRVLDEIQILSLAVAAGQRRRGLGRALVEHALAEELALATAHLEVRSNDAGAQAFYASLRFRPVGRRIGFYPGGIDAISMSRDLQADPPGCSYACELVNP